jgi:hypothetical protein
MENFVYATTTSSSSGVGGGVAAPSSSSFSDLEEEIKKKKAEVEEAGNKVKEYLNRLKGGKDDPEWAVMEKWEAREKILKEDLKELQQQQLTCM